MSCRNARPSPGNEYVHAWGGYGRDATRLDSFPTIRVVEMMYVLNHKYFAKALFVLLFVFVYASPAGCLGLIYERGALSFSYSVSRTYTFTGPSSSPDGNELPGGPVGPRGVGVNNFGLYPST